MSELEIHTRGRRDRIAEITLFCMLVNRGGLNADALREFATPMAAASYAVADAMLKARGADHG